MEIQKNTNPGSNGSPAIIELKQALRRAIVLVGFNTENITTEHWNIMIDYLQRNFPRITGNQVIEAFESGLRGELDVNLSHYQNFNAMYVSSVINAHKRHLANVRRNKPTPIEKQIAPPKKNIKDETEKLKQFKAGNKKNVPDWELLYEKMQNDGVAVMNNEQKKKFGALVRMDIENDITTREIEKRNTFHLELLINSPMFFKLECRKRMVLKYFKE